MSDLTNQKDMLLCWHEIEQQILREQCLSHQERAVGGLPRLSRRCSLDSRFLSRVEQPRDFLWTETQRHSFYLRIRFGVHYKVTRLAGRKRAANIHSTLPMH